ncbi:MAG: hypothetical protein JWO20_1477 [Candidatus Angelobacter sp.]|jgi:hypothetical protein|nr:hypothetical protein [Candidatus Angelobacter sp.]
MPASDQSLRKHLVSLLKDGGAHVGFDGAVRNMPFDLQGESPKGADHSPWQLLEHLRIAQWDILEFSRDSKHVSPKFPDGYWPSSPTPPDNHAWEKSADAFRADLKAMIKLIENESIDLFSKIPHGDGQTVLREALILADHNSYHLGQLVILRRLLGAWE